MTPAQALISGFVDLDAHWINAIPLSENRRRRQVFRADWRSEADIRSYFADRPIPPPPSHATPPRSWSEDEFVIADWVWRDRGLSWRLVERVLGDGWTRFCWYGRGVVERELHRRWRVAASMDAAENHAAALELWDEGESARQIAAALDVSPPTVAKWLRCPSPGGYCLFVAGIVGDPSVWADPAARMRPSRRPDTDARLARAAERYIEARDSGSGCRGWLGPLLDQEGITKQGVHSRLERACRRGLVIRQHGKWELTVLAKEILETAAAT